MFKLIHNPAQPIQTGFWSYLCSIFYTVHFEWILKFDFMLTNDLNMKLQNNGQEFWKAPTKIKAKTISWETAIFLYQIWMFALKISYYIYVHIYLCYSISKKSVCPSVRPSVRPSVCPRPRPPPAQKLRYFRVFSLFNVILCRPPEGLDSTRAAGTF